MKLRFCFLSCFVIFFLSFIGCSNKEKSQKQEGSWWIGGFPPEFVSRGIKEPSCEESIIIEDYVKYVPEDEVERLSVEKVINISFKESKAFVDGVSVSVEGISAYSDAQNCDVMVYLQKSIYDLNSEAPGVFIEYSGNENIKYSLSGSLYGTLKISNCNADCILEFNGLNINSSRVGPGICLTSDSSRTFVCVLENTVNSIVDNRVLNSGVDFLNDKIGSIYSSGALIFSGSTSRSSGGKLSIVNKGFNHGIYAHDYVRVWDINLDINCIGKFSRDCIRALNAVIINGGNINLVSKGSIVNAEGCGIKVEGEAVDIERNRVEFTAGAGFIIINGGNIKCSTVSKGMTAYWKSDETFIDKEFFTVVKNQSLLYGSGIFNGDAETPQPYLVINGGNIEIVTTGEMYEKPEGSCSPEGLEAKLDLVINNGNIVLKTIDDSINASGSIIINDGYVYAVSSKNDAIDTNGPSGITINGGVVYAKGVSIPECAFDCDSNPFIINGGVLVGFGSANYSKPSVESRQNVVVLGSSGYAGKSLAIIQNDEVSFACHIPLDCGDTIVLSSPDIAEGNYEIFSGGDFYGVVENNNFGNKMKYSGGTKVTEGLINSNVTEINVPVFAKFEDFNSVNFPDMPPEGFPIKN